jgi:hypothetical protein
MKSGMPYNVNADRPTMTSKKKQQAETSELKLMAARIDRLFGENNRARQISLSLAGILALLLLLGPAVPQELRAEAGSRLANLAQYLDSSLTDAWYSAFAAQGSDHRASVSGNNIGSGSQHIGASRILTGGEAHPSVDASESLVDFDASFGAGSESNATDRGLSDMLQDGNLGGSGGFGASAGSSASGNGSGGSGHQQSAGAGGSAGGAAPAGASRSSSGTHSNSARSPKSERASRLTNAHQGRVTGTGNGFASVYDIADASWNQLGPNESLNALEPGGAAWSSSGAGNDPFPTNGDGVGLNGHPPQGDGGSVFQNEGNGGNGHLDPPNTPHTDQGAVNQPTLTEPDSGPISGVPEPGSLVLLSLGLGAVILWGKLRPAR